MRKLTSGVYRNGCHRTGTPNPDGSFTIHFGGDPGSTNFLPISEGWNYVVRMYRTRAEILDGTWIFPGVETIK